MKHSIPRSILLFALAIGLSLSMEACASAENLKKIVISEPAHLVGHLPLFLAIREGYFQEEGLDVTMVQAAGGAHVTAVMGGSAWGVMGGVESNCLANQGNADPIISIVNCIDRANAYLFAAKGLEPSGSSDDDLRAFLQGKTIIAQRHGGSPNLLTRYLLLELGLDPEKDVTLIENPDATTVPAMIQHGQGQIGNGAEPQVSAGIAEGIWDEPFVKFHDMGEYAYAVISVKKSTIENDPETCQKFVNAMVRGLKTVQENRELTATVLREEFPTLSEEACKATLDRAYADNIWSPDGYISQLAVDRCMNVLIQTKFYSGTYSYADLVDMEFVDHATIP